MDEGGEFPRGVPETITEKEKVARALVNEALEQVQKKYGTGIGDGGKPKSYHNRVHTQDVLDAALLIAKESLTAGKIEASDIPLIKIAAAFHDIEQDEGGSSNEIKSAGLAEMRMRESGVFTDDDIRKVREMILATTVKFDKNGIMSQSATEDPLTQIIADADLAYLGGKPEAYWSKAIGFLKETKGEKDPSGEDKIAFAKSQPLFLGNHHFYTKEAKKLFPQKKDNIEFAKRQIKRLESQVNSV